MSSVVLKAISAAVLLAGIGSLAGAQTQAAAPEPSRVAQAPLSTDPSLAEKLHLSVPKNPSLPTLWLVGDSTVRNGHGDGAGGQWGWGEPLVEYFDPAKINVVNRAIGGRSSRTFITEGHWQQVLGMMKRGDFMLLQFGHNDSGPLDDSSRARGTINGASEESREIENPILKRHETVHTYGWYMRQYIEQAKAKGVTVIVCSLIPRKSWKDGHIVRSTESYAGWAHAVADAEHVSFIDLNEIIAREYEGMGEAAVEPMFADPHTHTSWQGAVLNAEAVVTGLKLLHPDPLAPFLSAKAAHVRAEMPALSTVRAQ